MKKTMLLATAAVLLLGAQAARAEFLAWSDFEVANTYFYATNGWVGDDNQWGLDRSLAWFSSYALIMNGATEDCTQNPVILSKVYPNGVYDVSVNWWKNATNYGDTHLVLSVEGQVAVAGDNGGAQGYYVSPAGRFNVSDGRLDIVIYTAVSDGGAASWYAMDGFYVNAVSLDSGVNIGLICADDPIQHVVKDYLIGTGLFTAPDISYIDVRNTTPLAADLMAFDAVLVWSMYAPQDRVALGDNLASYVDAGGGVVLAAHCYDGVQPRSLGGRIMTATYSPYIGLGSETLTTAFHLGDYSLTSSIFDGVADVTGIDRDVVQLNPGATGVANWNDNKPAVAYSRGGRVVGITMYPYEQNVQSAGGNYAMLFANSLLYASGYSRGHMILLNKGLQIQAQVFPSVTGAFDLKRWAESRFTTANQQWSEDCSYFGPPPGITWGYWNSSTGPLLNQQLPYLPNLVSIQYRDEQDLGDPILLNDAIFFLSGSRRRYPRVISFTSQSGAQQLTDLELATYMWKAKPDMLGMAYYPYFGTLVGGSPTGLYVDMQKYRLYALLGNDGSGTYPIPSHQYTQTIEQSGHAPSESEMRQHQFTSWAFGYKLVSAFVFDSPPVGQNVVPALFTGLGYANPTPAFYYSAILNRESKNLGPSLIRLLSTDIRMIVGQHRGPGNSTRDNALPTGIQRWDENAGPFITSINARNLGTLNDTRRGDVFIGYFRVLNELLDGPNYQNEPYFMIVNGLAWPTGSADQTKQEITIGFDFGTSGITSLQRLSRNTGLVEDVPLVYDPATGYHLVLVLPGGTGDLFKFKTGAPFVGQ